jgi:ABC-type multidrug transport system fused ATPase/permease subunit
MARIYAEMQRTVASAERVFSLMDATPDRGRSPRFRSPRLCQRRRGI